MKEKLLFITPEEALDPANISGKGFTAIRKDIKFVMDRYRPTYPVHYIKVMEPEEAVTALVDWYHMPIEDARRVLFFNGTPNDIDAMELVFLVKFNGSELIVTEVHHNVITGKWYDVLAAEFEDTVTLALTYDLF